MNECLLNRNDGERLHMCWMGFICYTCWKAIIIKILCTKAFGYLIKRNIDDKNNHNTPGFVTLPSSKSNSMLFKTEPGQNFRCWAMLSSSLPGDSGLTSLMFANQTSRWVVIVFEFPPQSLLFHHFSSLRRCVDHRRLRSMWRSSLVRETETCSKMMMRGNGGLLTISYS